MAMLRAVSKEIACEDESADFDLGCAEERPPLIPEGDYEVGYVRATKPFWVFGSMRVLMYFRVLTPGEHNGVELYLPCKVSPPKGRKALASSSKLVRAWEVAMGHAPSRRDRLSTLSFKGKAFEAAVDSVKLDSRKQALPAENQYSIIRFLRKRTAGS